MHREAVLVLALAARKQFPKEFGGLGDELTTAYLSLHDKVKTAGLGDLQSRGYTDALTLIQRLIEFHGVNLRGLSRVNQAKLKRVIKSINELEDAEKEKFFLDRALPNRQIQTLLRLEHIADVTDVGISRRAEMGIAVGLYDGARYLEQEGDISGAAVSRWLENHYATSITQWRNSDCGRSLGIKTTDD
jgi:hypothetical protein